MNFLRRALLPSVPLVVTGLVLAVLVASFAERQLDRALEARARALARAASEGLPSSGAKPHFYFQAWRASGEIVARSESLGIAGQLVRSPVSSSVARFSDVELPDGQCGRQAALEAAGISVAVAVPRADLDAHATLFRALLAALFAGFCLVLGHLAHTAASRAAARQHAEAEAARARQRRMMSDVAHELRTPVAELRNLAEVALRWPEDRAAVAGFIADVREIARAMAATIDDLEILTRSQSGLERVEARPVALGEVIGRVWPKIVARAGEQGLECRLETAPDLVATTDPDKLQLIVLNLLTNAVTYSRRGGTIELRARREGERLQLAVANPPRDLETADLEPMFDRFWRKDVSRSGPNAGLGLALVRALAELLGIEVYARLEDGILTMTLSIPAA